MSHLGSVFVGNDAIRSAPPVLDPQRHEHQNVVNAHEGRAGVHERAA
jgi:hypothetical protein